MIKSFWNSYWPGLIWTIAIFILLVLPGSSFPKNNWIDEIHLDKWIHIFLFGGFVVFWSQAFRHQSSSQQKKAFFKLFLAGIVFGILMEVIQHFWLSNRSFEVADILSDTGGSLTGWLIANRRHRQEEKKERPL